MTKEGPGGGDSGNGEGKKDKNVISHEEFQIRRELAQDPYTPEQKRLIILKEMETLLKEQAAELERQIESAERVLAEAERSGAVPFNQSELKARLVENRESYALTLRQILETDALISTHSAGKEGTPEDPDKA